MNILMFSDFYAHGVMGTKRSIKEELEHRGHKITFKMHRDIHLIIPMINASKAEQVWLLHSGLVLSPETKKRIKIPVIGFGFSDPYYFTPNRLKSYDVYITYHFGTWENYYRYHKYKNLQPKIPVLYCQTACDLNFHRNLNMKKDIDLSIMGVGMHPRFRNPKLRIQVIRRLRKETKFKIIVHGRKWDNHPLNLPHIDGWPFLETINRTKLGLDIQENWCPLAHKIFEYSACGTPVITAARPEVEMVFNPGKEILTFERYDDLKEKIDYYLNQHPEELKRIGKAAQVRCVKEHNISNRVDRILEFLKGVI